MNFSFEGTQTCDNANLIVLFALVTNGRRLVKLCATVVTGTSGKSVICSLVQRHLEYPIASIFSLIFGEGLLLRDRKVKGNICVFKVDVLEDVSFSFVDGVSDVNE